MRHGRAEAWERRVWLGDFNQKFAFRDSMKFKTPENQEAE